MDKEVKLVKPLKKVSTLPNLDDEDDFVHNENLSSSIVESSFLCSTTSLSPGEEDEDELPVGILKLNSKSQKLKAGDLAWIKHSRKFCFWPSYIKSVSGNKVSAYYICYHKFLPSEKSFRYSLNSKKIFKYPGADCKKLIEESRNFLSDEKKIEGGEMSRDIISFNNAVELAEAYILYRSNNEFSSRSEELDFFRSNGLSLCLKSTAGDYKSTSCSRPPTPVEQDSDTDTSSSFSPSGASCPETFSEQSEKFNLETETIKRPRSSIPFRSDVDGNCLGPTSSGLFSSQTPSSGETPRTRKRKRLNEFALFNKNNEKLVEYIVSGKCDKRLLEIFNLKIPSERMEAYFKVWDLHSPSPKRNNLGLQSCYYGNETQLEVVSHYLLDFIKENLTQVKSLTKKDELLFNVFLPEATIFSIHKVQKRSLSKAEEVFRKGHSGKDMPVEPLLQIPLTDEERASVERRNRNFAQKFGLETR